MLQVQNLKTWNTPIFSQLDQGWPLLTAGTLEQCNTMTVSWGGLGTLWGVPMATVYVRPQRYTKEFIDKEDYFTLSFLSQDYKKELALCGKESGRDMDKFKECGFSVAGETAPYIAQAELVLLCKKRFSQRMEGERFPSDVQEKWYPQKDYHQMYFGEVVEILSKGDL